MIAEWPALGLALAVARAGATALAAGGAPPTTGLLEIRREHVVVQGRDLSRGAAALTTLPRYQHGENITERELAKRLFGQEEYLADPSRARLQRRFSLLDLERATDLLGCNGVGYGQIGVDDLIEKAPIIVPVSLFGYDHSVIFRGRLADPAYGNRTMTVARVPSAWAECQGIGRGGFVVEARGGLAVPDLLAATPGDFQLLRSLSCSTWFSIQGWACQHLRSILVAST